VEKKSVSMPMVVKLGSLGLWHHNDVGLLKLYYAAKKHGEIMIMRCILTNLGSLNTIMPFKWSENDVNTSIARVVGMGTQWGPRPLEK
jgi:hypothetical protein